MRGFRGWNERGYLPHRDEPGLTQFVTFHLADSFPAALRSEWEAVLQVEDDRERRLQIEKYLDKVEANVICVGQTSQSSWTTPSAFTMRNGMTCAPGWSCPTIFISWSQVGETPLSKIVKELKRYTSREANKILRRTGAFWCEDYFDTYMRDEQHELKTRHYIENNPVKALLVREPKEWPWSSARFRDESGNLCS